MTRTSKRAARLAAGSVLLVCAVLGVALVGGARVNTTRSIPVGLYWTSDRPVRQGEYVLACPPHTALMAEARRRGYLAAGPCPGGFGYLMKRVAAMAGDYVAFGPAGVSVNGVLLAASAPLVRDGAGRRLPRFDRPPLVLPSNQLLLMSNGSRSSFDARYFGPVGRGQIETVIVPVLTW